MVLVEVMDERGPIELEHGVVEPAFEAFFRREYRSVLGLAFVLCGNRWAAEELTMEAFEKALRDWRRVSRLDSPAAWVRKVVSNGSVSRFRTMAAERRAKSRMIVDERTQPLDEISHPEVWEAVRRLPRRQAQAVALFHVDGYRRREIAQVLGISEESVKTHLERGRRRLTEELAEDGED